MADPLAVIIRFTGDQDDLLERFERARRMWIEEQRSDYERPVFYAACRTDEGIAIVNVWEPPWHTGRSARDSTFTPTRWAWARRIASSGCDRQGRLGLKTHRSRSQPD
jgi:hypothetical protein